ncbi:hypothetical protein CHR55_33610 [Rhodococcus qingshengii]|uniref:Uncharacterized protein n=1 Tax=Rhodococcus qingshengii TaxID=334542 RepID=A0A2A5IY95_RHOSG|nr:hypothetical protein CHR55_33610 [Rhodococcus qingshengii]
MRFRHVTKNVAFLLVTRIFRIIQSGFIVYSLKGAEADDIQWRSKEIEALEIMFSRVIQLDRIQFYLGISLE